MQLKLSQPTQDFKLSNLVRTIWYELSLSLWLWWSKVNRNHKNEIQSFEQLQSGETLRLFIIFETFKCLRKRNLNSTLILASTSLQILYNILVMNIVIIDKRIIMEQHQTMAN